MNPACGCPALRIFLVEDSIPVRRRIAASLGTIHGVEIVGEAEEPATALVAISAGQVDIVIVDLRLNSGSGLELLDNLTHIKPPVISMVLTNHSDASFRAASQSVGAHYFFDKTCEFHLAHNTIRRIVYTHMLAYARAHAL